MKGLKEIRVSRLRKADKRQMKKYHEHIHTNACAPNKYKQREFAIRQDRRMGCMGKSSSSCVRRINR